MRIYIRIPAATRFEEKYIPEPNTGCWLWFGAVSDTGYGNFVDDNHLRVNAHRWSYEKFVGAVPEGLVLDHLCRVRCCVNPRHLEPVTMRVNNLRGFGASGNNARKTHCVNGHEFTQNNTYRYDESHGRQCKTCHRSRALQRIAVSKASGEARHGG